MLHDYLHDVYKTTAYNVIAMAAHDFEKSETKETSAESFVSGTVSMNEFQKYYSLTLKLVNAFCANVVAHPFIVLRRQCQVNRTAKRYHLLPLTLIPIIIKIQGRQGLGTLWKGIGSVFIVKGLVIIFEDIFSKISSFPKEPSKVNNVKQVGQHILLKFAAVFVITPFYSASLVETVQSDIASEKPGIIDCITEGLIRIVPCKQNPTSTIVPVWSLAVLTAVYGVSRYIIGGGFQHLALSCFKFNIKKQKRTDINARAGHNQDGIPMLPCLPPNIHDSESLHVDWGYSELMSALIGSLASDTLFYPLETVMHRMHVQGTRTIVDSLDTGLQVVPLVTRYEGLADCFCSVVSDEGICGLYKGFGALLLEYIIHAVILKLSMYLLQEIHEICSTDHSLLKHKR